MSIDTEGYSHRFVDSDGVALHCAERGPEDGELVVMLHGFPEFWWSWRHQMKALAEKGYRVVAPDIRGYNLSDAPDDVAAYRLPTLAKDVAAIIAAYGREKATVVGHDWGGMVAWEFGMHHPHMLTRLAILNVPHPVRMKAGLKTLRQLVKSWYIFFFQIPLLPEWAVSRVDYALVRRSFKDSMSHDDIARYVDAAKRGRNLVGGINYYRALVRDLARGKVREARSIDKPVLVIWGDQDRFLGKELSEPPSKLVPQLRVHHIPSASHWVQLDAPAEVNEQLLRFINGEV